LAHFAKATAYIAYKNTGGFKMTIEKMTKMCEKYHAQKMEALRIYAECMTMMTDVVVKNGIFPECKDRTICEYTKMTAQYNHCGDTDGYGSLYSSYATHLSIYGDASSKIDLLLELWTLEFCDCDYSDCEICEELVNKFTQ
jgi:hypothetical protein